MLLQNYQPFETDASIVLQRRIAEIFETLLSMREQRSFAGTKTAERRKLLALPASQSNGRSTAVQQPLNENQQSKVKESKVKEKRIIIAKSSEKCSQNTKNSSSGSADNRRSE